MMISRQIPY